MAVYGTGTRTLLMIYDAFAEMKALITAISLMRDLQ